MVIYDSAGSFSEESVQEPYIVRVPLDGNVIYSSFDTQYFPGGRVWRPIAQLVLIQSGCRWAWLIDNRIAYHESVQGPYILRVPLGGNVIYSFFDKRYIPGGRV